MAPIWPIRDFGWLPFGSQKPFSALPLNYSCAYRRVFNVNSNLVIKAHYHRAAFATIFFVLNDGKDANSTIKDEEVTLNYKIQIPSLLRA